MKLGPPRTPALALAALLLLPGCTMQREQQTVADYVDDSTVTARVKARLSAEPGLAALGLQVSTVKGVVQLDGTVHSSAERQVAERLARQTPGAIDVQDRLVLQP